MERNFFNGAISRARGLALFLALGLVAVSAAGCNGTEESSYGASLGRRALGSAEEVAGGTEQLTIAVHYLAFKNTSGGPVADQAGVEKMVDHMTKVWSRCGIGFTLERYEAIEPLSVKARFSPANYSELDSMRINAQSDNFITLMGTGTWNRSGDLGNSGSNCYSSFPGDEADGVVCEAKTAISPTLMAHEVGHWLNLRHTDGGMNDSVDDTNAGNSGYNLMNHVVAPQNDDMTDGQCYRARYAIGKYRRNSVVM